MTFSEFLSLCEIKAASSPEHFSPELKVLFYSKQGNWEKAHDIAQDLPGDNGSWLHAFLHREEGDLGNAAYWYHCAGQPTPAVNLSLSDEWNSLAQHFCEV